jgi:hypothetical protein
MIKGIGTSQSKWINVMSPGISTPYGNVSNGVDGQLRLNMSTQQYEVFANGIWNITGEYATVNPSQRMIEILEWAESKMHMEQEVMELLAKNPTVADSYNNYKQAESQLKIVMTLVKESA